MRRKKSAFPAVRRLRRHEERSGIKFWHKDAGLLYVVAFKFWHKDAGQFEVVAGKPQRFATRSCATTLCAHASRPFTVQPLPLPTSRPSAPPRAESGSRTKQQRNLKHETCTPVDLAAFSTEPAAGLQH